MFPIFQRYNFESNSQHIDIALTFHFGCFLPHKSYIKFLYINNIGITLIIGSASLHLRKYACVVVGREFLAHELDDIHYSIKWFLILKTCCKYLWGH